jgi:hypothetical protein
MQQRTTQPRAGIAACLPCILSSTTTTVYPASTGVGLSNVVALQPRGGAGLPRSQHKAHANHVLHLAVVSTSRLGTADWGTQSSICRLPA